MFRALVPKLSLGTRLMPAMMLSPEAIFRNYKVLLVGFSYRTRWRF
jgi:hypothetical protein